MPEGSGAVGDTAYPEWISEVRRLYLEPKDLTEISLEEALAEAEAAPKRSRLARRFRRTDDPADLTALGADDEPSASRPPPSRPRRAVDREPSTAGTSTGPTRTPTRWPRAVAQVAARGAHLRALGDRLGSSSRTPRPFRPRCSLPPRSPRRLSRRGSRSPRPHLHLSPSPSPSPSPSRP